mmetsp:Transcript_10886/g.19046  ORF Transcript_10886/g.19046 Transcript_10886/m.19046 type:complete len:161 (-) Transcript_10886:208-690(-)|eukprot:CAMPEP_0183721888 /NCGR_PEP_ID=MMETSP0737-20130205/14010_1 /TAXON_ID=385413 /ORGANISM="Thalassiosira miniscula, Strain CCMP1093" /LENGTH=160 /DNA_ID=CAMNT_0025951953 /DNA_START=54 /DNA_END=536 /DNA_ORIENTATION=-
MASIRSKPSTEMDDQQQAESRPFDAFQKYSDDFVRMKTILLKEDDSNFDMASLMAILKGGQDPLHVIRDEEDPQEDQCVESNATGKTQDISMKRRRGNDLRPIKLKPGSQRKTILSFEVHPCLLLHDIFQEDSSTSDAIAVEDGEEEDPLNKLLSCVNQK